MGDFGVFFGGQDKGHGPKPVNPLSAHRFSWPTKNSWWAKHFSGLLMPPKKSAGPKAEKSCF